LKRAFLWNILTALEMLKCIKIRSFEFTIFIIAAFENCLY